VVVVVGAGVASSFGVLPHLSIKPLSLSELVWPSKCTVPVPAEEESAEVSILGGGGVGGGGVGAGGSGVAAFSSAIRS